MSVGDPGLKLPTMSIVTPSFNQVAFLPHAMGSVLGQAYPELEYVVVDGGSTDGSRDVIETRADELAFWVSEKDGGQYDAINKGFLHTSGEVMGWINSDDLYFPRALHIVGEIFGKYPEVEWLTTQFPCVFDAEGAVRACDFVRGYGREPLLRGAYLTGGDWYARGVVQQESTFWRRSLWERAGGRVDASMAYAGDFDLWVRFATHADLYCVAAPLGGFRRHEDQKTAAGVPAYFEEAKAALLKHGGRTYGPMESGVREFFNRLFGGRPLPTLHSSARTLLLNLGVTYAATCFSWEDGEWKPTTRVYV